MFDIHVDFVGNIQIFSLEKKRRVGHMIFTGPFRRDSIDRPDSGAFHAKDRYARAILSRRIPGDPAVVV